MATDNSPRVELYQVFFIVNFVLILTVFSLIAPFILISIHEIVNCSLIGKEDQFA